jgi:hypothetical protein
VHRDHITVSSEDTYKPDDALAALESINVKTDSTRIAPVDSLRDSIKDKYDAPISSMSELKLFSGDDKLIDTQSHLGVLEAATQQLHSDVHSLQTAIDGNKNASNKNSTVNVLVQHGVLGLIRELYDAKLIKWDGEKYSTEYTQVQDEALGKYHRTRNEAYKEPSEADSLKWQQSANDEAHHEDIGNVEYLSWVSQWHNKSYYKTKNFSDLPITPYHFASDILIRKFEFDEKSKLAEAMGVYPGWQRNSPLSTTEYFKNKQWHSNASLELLSTRFFEETNYGVESNDAPLEEGTAFYENTKPASVEGVIFDFAHRLSFLRHMFTPLYDALYNFDDYDSTYFKDQDGFPPSTQLKNMTISSSLTTLDPYYITEDHLFRAAATTIKDEGQSKDVSYHGFYSAFEFNRGKIKHAYGLTLAARYKGVSNENEELLHDVKLGTTSEVMIVPKVVATGSVPQPEDEPKYYEVEELNPFETRDFAQKNASSFLRDYKKSTGSPTNVYSSATSTFWPAITLAQEGSFSSAEADFTESGFSQIPIYSRASIEDFEVNFLRIGSGAASLDDDGTLVPLYQVCKKSPQAAGLLKGCIEGATTELRLPSALLRLVASGQEKVVDFVSIDFSTDDDDENAFLFAILKNNGQTLTADPDDNKINEINKSITDAIQKQFLTEHTAELKVTVVGYYEGSFEKINGVFSWSAGPTERYAVIVSLGLVANTAGVNIVSLSGDKTTDTTTTDSIRALLPSYWPNGYSLFKISDENTVDNVDGYVAWKELWKPIELKQNSVLLDTTDYETQVFAYRKNDTTYNYIGFKLEDNILTLKDSYNVAEALSSVVYRHIATKGYEEDAEKAIYSKYPSSDAATVTESFKRDLSLSIAEDTNGKSITSFTCVDVHAENNKVVNGGVVLGAVRTEDIAQHTHQVDKYANASITFNDNDKNGGTESTLTIRVPIPIPEIADSLSIRTVDEGKAPADESRFRWSSATGSNGFSLTGRDVLSVIDLCLIDHPTTQHANIALSRSVITIEDGGTLESALSSQKSIQLFNPNESSSMPQQKTSDFVHVKFLYDDGGEIDGLRTPYIVKSGSKVSEPVDTPTQDPPSDMVFVGWFTNEKALSNTDAAFDFNISVAKDMILYAKFGYDVTFYNFETYDTTEEVSQSYKERFILRSIVDLNSPRFSKKIIDATNMMYRSHWIDSETKENVDNIIVTTEKQTVIAQWKPIETEAKFFYRIADTILERSQTITKSTISANDLSIEGYDIQSLTLDNVSVDSTPVTDETTINALKALFSPDVPTNSMTDWLNLNDMYRELNNNDYSPLRCVFEFTVAVTVTEATQDTPENKGELSAEESNEEEPTQQEDEESD